MVRRTKSHLGREASRDSNNTYVQPIFQNPFESFSSRKTADSYLFETARNILGAKTKEAAYQAVDEALVNVGLSAERVIGRYPNQFSGGELQRVSVARAMIQGVYALFRSGCR